MGLQPQTILMYAGDNDLGDGKSPEQVIKSLHRMLELTNKTYPNSFFGFMSIKPSLARRDILATIQRTNAMAQQVLEGAGAGCCFINVYDQMVQASGMPIPELFDADGLHLSAAGYALWKQLLHAAIASQTIKMPERRILC